MAKTVKRGGPAAFRVVGGSARQNDAEARAAEFERLYRESYPMVYGRMLFQMRDEEAARDVTSEAFLRAARYFEGFDPSRAKFSTWVIAIARNCMVDYYRAHKAHASIEDVDESALAMEGDHSDHVVDADLARRLLAVLDEEDRAIVFMKFCEGWSNTEIAQELDMKPSTVATRVQRALAKMRAAGE